MKLNLRSKLFFSYLVVLFVGAIILFSVASLSLPGAYRRHMSEIDILLPSPDMMNATRGHGQGIGPGLELYTNFQKSFFEALGWALSGSIFVAIIISLFISRRIAAPLRTITNASQRIAEGHYDERVPAIGRDELSHLAISFNTMAEKLDHVENMRRRLIGDIAHELRTPLTAIRGSMEGLIDGVLPSSPDTFLQISEETERLNRLVDDLQELSRIESGSFVLERNRIPLSDLIDVVQKRLMHEYSVKPVELVIKIPESLPLVYVDSDRIVQVLTNLLVNALRYTSPGGRVEVSGEGSGEQVFVRVIDNGIGIPAEHLPYIFDRFYRVDQSRSRNSGGGSGIGLTISKRIIEAHNGQLWAESGGEGKGSSFQFTLPIL